MENWVAERVATLVEAAASSSNIQIPAILFILPSGYYLVWIRKTN
jgi:hypothetical protein